MKAEKVNINTLTIPEYCKRHHSKDQISKCISSLKKHGQYQPIVISEGEILCGVLIYNSLLAMKETEIWVNDLGPIPEEKKKEIRYLDNQIFDIEDWDEERIKSFLMDLDTSKLDLFGFSEEEAELIIQLDPEMEEAQKKLEPLWVCEDCGWEGRIEKKGKR